MKENTKYHKYRFIGKINVDQIQPWFDFGTSTPWDESEIPWVLDNKVRREILISLAKSPKSFKELYQNINFSPKPLLVTKEEHDSRLLYQWDKETVRNHLLSLEWYNLIKLREDKYEITFPIFNKQKLDQLENYVIKYANHWIKIILELKEEVEENVKKENHKIPLHAILIEKALNRLYTLLEEEKLLPNEPNIKILWAEQLRKEKFEEWVKNIF